MAWAPDYCTTAELKSLLRIGDTDDDTELALAITAASRVIDRATNRQFGVVSAVEDRVYETAWDRRRSVYVVEVDDFQTTTGLVVTDSNGDVTSNSALTLYPLRAAAKGYPWESFTVPTITPTVTVTAKWGWTSVPTPIKQATLLQASRIFKRKDSPFGVAGSPDLGSELRLLAKVDPDVEVIVGPFRRWWAGA